MRVKEMSSGKKGISIARPVVGIEGINKAVRALFAYKEPTFYKDLASAANMNPIYMSQALSASRDVGLTTLAGKRGLYKLTKQGEEYARLLSFGKHSECRELMGKIIMDNPMWSQIITFLRVSKGTPREPLDLVLKVERESGKRWSSTMRDRIGAVYSSILEYAGLIKVEKGMVLSQVGIEEEKVVSEKVEKEVSERVIEQPSMLVPTEDFAEFRLPDSFIIYVRKDAAALDFFKTQIKKESMLVPWIEFIRGKMTKKEAVED